MQIESLKTNDNSFSSWSNVLQYNQPVSLYKSVITGKVKLNLHGTINVNYDKIDDVPDVSFYVPVLAHVIHHKKYGYFLIDAGLDKSYYENGYGLCKGTLLNEYGSYFIQNKNQNILNFIHKTNIQLSGVFLTHIHVDHVSGIMDLDDNIPIYISDREKSMDIKPFYYAEYFKNKKLIKTFPIDEFIDTPLLGKCLDIFGDKSFYAVHTPGHTAGHISYLINGDEKILLAGDACFTNESIKYKTAPSDYTWNIKQAQESLDKILKFKKCHNIKIIPGHSI